MCLWQHRDTIMIFIMKPKHNIGNNKNLRLLEPCEQSCRACITLIALMIPSKVCIFFYLKRLQKWDDGILVNCIHAIYFGVNVFFCFDSIWLTAKCNATFQASTCRESNLPGPTHMMSNTRCDSASASSRSTPRLLLSRKQLSPKSSLCIRKLSTLLLRRLSDKISPPVTAQNINVWLANTATKQQHVLRSAAQKNKEYVSLGKELYTCFRYVIATQTKVAKTVQFTCSISFIHNAPW